MLFRLAHWENKHTWAYLLFYTILKRLQKYTETKVKAFKARNEYILSIDSANACIKNFSTEDIGDLVDVRNV